MSDSNPKSCKMGSMNLIQELVPNPFYLLGVIWILREVFGFLHKYKINGNGKVSIKDLHFAEVIKENSRVLNLILRVLERVEVKIDFARDSVGNRSSVNPDTRM